MIHLVGRKVARHRDHNTRNLVYVGQAMWDNIKILNLHVGHLISIMPDGWDSIRGSMMIWKCKFKAKLSGNSFIFLNCAE